MRRCSPVQVSALIGAVALLTSCGTSEPRVFHSSSTTTTVAPAATQNPKVQVTPSTNLKDGEMVEVEVTGFEIGGKFFVSECATAADANSDGCGTQLAAQPFGLTNNSRAGSQGFTVTSMAPTSPYNTSSTHPCTDQCVIVATVGTGYGYAYAPISFSGN